MSKNNEQGLGGNLKSVHMEDFVFIYILRDNMRAKCEERLLLPRLALFVTSLHFQ